MLEDVSIYPKNYDVIVIGGGNAALCAAISARDLGVSVLVLEKSNEVFRGGNSRHTRNIRYTHPAANDWLTGPYPEEECFNDLIRVTGGNTTENLARLCIRESYNIGDWMVAHGAMFQPSMRGTLHLGRTNSFFLGGGRGLMNGYYAFAKKNGIDIMYESPVVDIAMEGSVFKSVTIKNAEGRHIQIYGKTVVIAAGGSQANPGFLAKHWGDAAYNFRVRGCPYDTGEVLEMLLNNGVQSVGDPTQGHMVAVDARAPKVDGGIVTRLDCVPFSVVVNKHAQRFYDEGEEFWPKRYAIWGRLVAGQDDQIGHCIIDSKSIDLFMPSVFPPVEANSLEELARKLNLDVDTFLKTIKEFNDAVVPGGNFNPDELDGCHTNGITPAKTNWARPINEPPYYGYALAPGITFTYQGTKVNEKAHVLMQDGSESPNVFACGEIMSGNILGKGYMAGFGMTIGTVFGRIAGTEAGKYVKR